MRGISAVVSVLVLIAACDESAAVGEPVTERGLRTNDIVLQGPGLVLQGPGLVLQGPGLVLQGPGLVLQGPGLVLQGPGLVLQGVSLNGPGLVLQGPGLVLQGPGLVLQGTSFAGTLLKDGVAYDLAGLDFIGAEFSLRLTAIVGGQQIVQGVILRIDDIRQSSEQADVYLYDLSYRTDDSEQWLPYCGDSQIAAVPMHNSWDHTTGARVDDPNVVTFGCTNAALAKCALWGYRPWAEGTRCDKHGDKCEDISLQDHHQACTRMARADYCGDGVARTVDGTKIDIWDDLSPALQVPFTNWPVEAEWDPNGATCLDFTRHPEFGYPACFVDKHGKPAKFNKCGEFKQKTSLLANAFSTGEVAPR